MATAGIMTGKFTEIGDNEDDFEMEIDDDTYFSSPEVIKEIKEAEQEIREGKGILIRNEEELKQYFDCLTYV